MACPSNVQNSFDTEILSVWGYIYYLEVLIANSSNFIIWTYLGHHYLCNLAFFIYLYSLYYIFVLTSIIPWWMARLEPTNLSSYKMLYGTKEQSQRTELKIVDTFLLSYINMTFWSSLVLLVHFNVFGPLRSFCSTSVHFRQFRFIGVHWSLLWSIRFTSVYFGDALEGEVCVERWTASLTIMSLSQCNVCKFL